ncbi:BnaC09g53380D [Brassica napus]|uniref:BnaC09g53380D protein n=2 Tax=Brassica TaxID=3705 RepID=A0A078IUP3_BRANA|nr:BnaC09g53380D [Brassica napus]
MDKASIIKDAISYIQGLQYEESKLEAEIRELESTPKSSLSFSKDFDRDLLVPVTSKKMKQLDSGPSRSLIEVLDLKVTFMGERTVVVNVTCNKRTDTMVKLCEVFESLNLKIITSNLNSFSGMIFNTVFIEAEEEEQEVVRLKIETGIGAYNETQSPTLSIDSLY